MEGVVVESGELYFGVKSGDEMDYGEKSHSETGYGEMSHCEMNCDDDLRYRAPYGREYVGLRDSDDCCDHQSTTDLARHCRGEEGIDPLDLICSDGLK